MCTRRERFDPTVGAAASTVSQKIGRIERGSPRVCLTPNRGRGCGRGSADGCGDGDDDSSIEDWISAYPRDPLDTAGEWESCRDTLSWSLRLHLASSIGLHVVTVEIQNLGVLQSGHFPNRYETGFTRR